MAAGLPQRVAEPPTQTRQWPGAGRRIWFYAGGLMCFVAAMALAEQHGLPRSWIAALMLLVPVVLYAGIGLGCRTSNTVEYFVAGRRIPGVYNGMAIAADWMSVASFMSLAGLLYVSGFSGLAYVLGWTGGFCLVALYLAPYLRRFGQFTIPDFLGARYGTLPRAIGLTVTMLCSFVYVVAQIYGVGLITSRLTGFTFELGVFVGLGGILVCSFLGGMRAVTWTQVVQYLILLLAFLVPAVWLAVKQTGNPVPVLVLGSQLAEVSQREKAVLADPAERQVVEAFGAEARRYAAKLADVEQALAADRAAARRRLDDVAVRGAPLREVRAAERELKALPRDAAAARVAWQRTLASLEERARPLGGLSPQARQFAGDAHGTDAQRQAYDESRLNFMALVFCLMAGTAGLPHLLSRFYTTPSVQQSRSSVTWAVLFIVMLYLTIPVLAVLLKHEVLFSLVGRSIGELPRWVADWSRLDPSLISVTDINRDGVLQFGELRIHSDILVLAAPEIGGMPFVVTCLVAAGGLAAALSTADGLLLTTANALSHDLYFRWLRPDASPRRQVLVSKGVLLLVAVCAASIATQKPAHILLLITPVFSVAAATLFPPLVLGIFWQRTTGAGAAAGMLAGLSVTLYYLLSRAWPGAATVGDTALWWGIQPTSAGVFGVPLAFAVTVAVSLATRPDAGGAALARKVRQPEAATRETDA